MGCLAENGEDPEALVVQVARFHAHILDCLRRGAAVLRMRGRGGLH